jgi:hypothetical protein
MVFACHNILIPSCRHSDGLSVIGVKKEDLPNLFGEFIPFDEKRNSQIEGAGLGLAIAKSLRLSMGGQIEVRSEYSQGAAFTATVVQEVADWAPMGDLNQPPADQPEEQAVTFETPEAEALVVNDFQNNLMVAEGLLTPYRMSVQTCVSDREALASLQGRAIAKCKRND